MGSGGWLGGTLFLVQSQQAAAENRCSRHEYRRVCAMSACASSNLDKMSHRPCETVLIFPESKQTRLALRLYAKHVHPCCSCSCFSGRVCLAFGVSTKPGNSCWSSCVSVLAVCFVSKKSLLTWNDKSVSGDQHASQGTILYKSWHCGNLLSKPFAGQTRC